jgi:aspartate/tyrosine/aromatic aminotransferase
MVSPTSRTSFPEIFYHPILTRRLGEVKKMADRIIAMREKLYNALIELKTPGEWGHIKSQIGEWSQIRRLCQKRILLFQLLISRHVLLYRL